MTTTTEVDTLREFVERHRVCWEAWPEFAIVKGKQIQIGFELELFGAHDPEVEHILPGCEHCQGVFLGLAAVAEWIQPKENRPSRYEIEPYQPALRYSRQRGYRPEVSLTIRILHRQDALRPVDACEERCLGEMAQKLSVLGAGQGSWSGRRGD